MLICYVVVYTFLVGLVRLVQIFRVYQKYIFLETFHKIKDITI